MENTPSPRQVMINSLKSKTPIERKQERRDSLDNCCQTPSYWKEPTKYDINKTTRCIHRKVHKELKKKKSTSFHVIYESRPIEEQAIGNNRQSMT